MGPGHFSSACQKRSTINAESMLASQTVLRRSDRPWRHSTSLNDPLNSIKVRNKSGREIVRKSTDLPKTIICSSALILLLVIGAPANAHEIQVNGSPCNDLCQAWLGYGGHDDSTGSTTANFKLMHRRSTPPSLPTSSAPPLKTRRPEKEVVKVERNYPSTEPSAPEVPQKAVAAKHVHPEDREAQANVPLPVPRPVMPRVEPALAASATTAASRSPASPRNLSEAAAPPDEGTRLPASITQALPPPPDRPAAPDISKLQKEPRQTLAPTATATAAAVAPSTVSASSSSQKPTITTSVRHDDGTKPLPDPNAASPTPIASGDRGRPDDQATPAYKPAVQQPSTVVASLPSPANAGSGLRDADHPSGSTQEDRLQPTPELAGTLMPVTVGHISAEPRGTDVHVVVVNLLQREMKDVYVRCRARDAQGLQVAEASAYLESIAPSDVAFGQVLFPAEITAQDNKFTCETGNVEASRDGTP